MLAESQKAQPGPSPLDMGGLPSVSVGGIDTVGPVVTLDVGLAVLRSGVEVGVLDGVGLVSTEGVGEGVSLGSGELEGCGVGVGEAVGVSDGLGLADGVSSVV